MSVRSVTSPVLHCPFRRKKVKGGLRPFLSAVLADRQAEAHTADKNKPLTFFHLHFQSRPRGSKLHYILGRIYARIYPLDIGCLSCYNMCSGYIASSLKCYHFRTCEGGKPPSIPFLESRKAHNLTVVAPKKERSKA